MEKTGFTITNKFGVIIELSLEPEGTIYELKPNESVEIEISTGASPIIDIQIQKTSIDLCIALWNAKGEYQIDDAY